MWACTRWFHMWTKNKNMTKIKITMVTVLMIALAFSTISFSVNVAGDDFRPLGYDYTYTFTDGSGFKWYVKAFTSGNGTWTPPSHIDYVDILVVAGGGGAGYRPNTQFYYSGGGGGGGLVWLQYYHANGSMPYSVGSGGIGSTVMTVQGGSGGDTTFGILTAKGGGGGGSASNTAPARKGVAGGSGGGAAASGASVSTGGAATQPSESRYSGLYGYGNAGADSIANTAGGGGGAGGPGGTPTRQTGGASKNMSAYFGNTYGKSGNFASGGGAQDTGSDAVANSGMGGRARATGALQGRNGGSGIILIRWRDVAYIEYESEYPLNRTVGVPVNIGRWKVNITHPLGNKTNGTIECSNGEKTSWTNQPNGTRTLTLSALNENTIYTIWVNFTDRKITEHKTFWFLTHKTFIDGDGVKWTIIPITDSSWNGGQVLWDIGAVLALDILVVAGGGGSGMGTTTITQNGGGGGAGGLIWMTDYSVDDGSSFSIGEGGSGAATVSVKGGTGTDTTFGILTAKGGGGGGSTSNRPGVSGGSGGGAAINAGGTDLAGGSATQPLQYGWSGLYGHGNNGANGLAANYAGGGGGAGSAGSTFHGGSGMNMSSYFGTTWGKNGWFASGGGAHNDSVNAIARSGMGGRARATNDGGTGRPGGSGIVLLRWSNGIYVLNENPINSDSNVDPIVGKWTVDILHGSGHTTNGTIECSNGEKTSWTNQPNGTRTLTLSALSSFTTYYVWVNVTAGLQNKKRTYYFSTLVSWTDENGLRWVIKPLLSGSGFWTVPTLIGSVDILVVGGGGGGGTGSGHSNSAPGAGGAGGLVWIQNVTQLGTVKLIPGSIITYSVGGGGSGGSGFGGRGGSGSDTTFGNLTTVGGGGGGASHYTSSIDNGYSGGSGGGAAVYSNPPTEVMGTGGAAQSSTGWSGLYGHGNNGASAIFYAAGGGGGAGSAGGSPNTYTGGSGMNMSSYFGTTWGKNGWFASGGGAQDTGSDAVANSGMGGRGLAKGIGSSTPGRAGGSGIILIKWSSHVLFLYETPTNGSIDVTGLLTNWSVYVYYNNIDDDVSSGTIECSNGDNMSWANETAGTKTLNFTDWLDYNTTHYVWVNVTYKANGETLYKNETYNFKTETSKLSGTILDIYDQPLNNVKVVAKTNPEYATYTDGEGYYEFENIVCGSDVAYNITTSKFAYSFSPKYRNESLTRSIDNINFIGSHYFFDGTGTPEDPFTIKNCTHLNNIRLLPNYAFVLYNDLNLSECGVETWNDGKGFEPICNETTPFNGTFDGGGHIISNLYINYSDFDYVGLFGYVENADIRNLGLLSANVAKGNYTGGLAGYVDNTTIQICFINSDTVTGNNYAGGLIGVLDNSTLDNCYARIKVVGSTYGGLIGLNVNSFINHTYSTGDVTGGGGLIGNSQSSATLNSYFDNATSGTQTSDGGIGYSTSILTSLSFWEQTNFSFPEIWFYDQNQNDKYPLLSIFTTITPPLLRDVNRAGSLTQQIYRYLNSSYNPEDYCFFNVTAYVPQERYAGRWNKNVDDRYFIATGIEEPGWTDTKDNYVLATRVTATYTGYYDQMRVFTIWHGHYPSTLGCSIYSDMDNEPGERLGYTDAWNIPIDRDSIWFPDYSHVWLTLNLTSSVFISEGTSYWLLVTTNDSSMWRESYAMPGMNLSGMSDYIWTLGTTIGSTSNVKMLPYNVTLNIPNKEYIDPYEGTEWEGLYGYWKGDVQNSTFSWPTSFEDTGWKQGKDITSTNLSQLLIYALCSVDVSHVDILNVKMTWGTGTGESIVWNEPVNMSRVSPNMDYWEYNKTDISGGDWNTWKVTLYDEFGNIESYDYYRWMKHGETERIYFQCNVSNPTADVKYLNSTTNLYSDDWIFYLYEAYYDDTPDIYGDNEGRKQALRHEQGVDGSAYDTGYWTTEIPTDEYNERTCAFFVGGAWDQNVVIHDNITIENAFVSWWMGSGRQLIDNSTGEAQNIHWGRADTEASFDEFYIRDYGYGDWESVTYHGLQDTIAWQDMPLSRRLSNDWINFNESTWYDPPLFDNSTGRITDRVVRQVVQKINFSLLKGTEYPNTFDSNSIYQLFAGIDYNAMYASGANAILVNNISHPSFIIFNVPDDAELCVTDSNDDGVTDYEALYLYGLQPFLNDTDNDNFTDIQELSRDTGANLYREYPDGTNIILIKDMTPFKDNDTNTFDITLSVTIENPNAKTMDLDWYILRNFTFNSSYVHQNQLLDGEWELVQTNSSISNGTYTMYLDGVSSGNNYWAVNVSDSFGWWGNRSSVFSGPSRQLNGTILRNGVGMLGVNVTVASNDTGRVYYDLTDSDGYYQMAIPGGDYVVTPNKVGYFFTPQHRYITIGMENSTANFTAIGAPVLSNEYPYNNSWEVSNSIIWAISINADYEFDWSIECSDGNGSSDTNDVSGRKNLSLSNLEYDTWYTVWVNSSNSEYTYVKNNVAYDFRVRELKTDYPGQPVDFIATAISRTQIDLSWTKGINATKTYIQYIYGIIPPSNRDVGGFLYNDTGTSTNAIDLVVEEPTYLDIAVTPTELNFGSVGINTFTNTEDYYFRLINHGMNCSVDITISNSQNWTFVNYSNIGDNKFSVNFSKDDWASETNIESDGTTELVDNLQYSGSQYSFSAWSWNETYDSWSYMVTDTTAYEANQPFDIKAMLPTSSVPSNGESFTITFIVTAL